LRADCSLIDLSYDDSRNHRSKKKYRGRQNAYLNQIDDEDMDQANEDGIVKEDSFGTDEEEEVFDPTSTLNSIREERA